MRAKARAAAPRLASVLGLPENVRACLFDLDGVLTRTAVVHAAAWKQMFDEFLKSYAHATNTDFVPFDAASDYDRFVDGKSRDDGTRSFLASRGISLPDGGDGDDPGAQTVYALGVKKNDLVLRIIKEQGVDAYPGSVRYVHALRDAGIPRAVVSSSTNARDVLEAAGIADLFEARIDGVVIARDHLPGKPAPDAFLAGARALDVPPAHAAVFEDALAGVAAGRAGDFGYVIGVDRVDQASALRDHGADIVVEDLDELLGGNA